MDRSGPIWPPDELLGGDSEAFDGEAFDGEALDGEAFEGAEASGGGAGSGGPARDQASGDTAFGGDDARAVGDADDPAEPLFVPRSRLEADQPGPAPMVTPTTPPVQSVPRRSGGQHAAPDDDEVLLTPDDWLQEPADTSVWAPPATDGLWGRPPPAIASSPWAQPPRPRSDVPPPPPRMPTRPLLWSTPPPTPPAPASMPPAAPTQAATYAPATTTAPTTAPPRRPPMTPAPEAPGVYPVGPAVRALTVVCRNSNAGRAVARLLTITLLHPAPEAWILAAGTVGSDIQAQAAAGRLARDEGLAVIDAGSDVRTPSWREALDATDRLIIAVNAAGSGPAEASAMLDAFDRSTYASLARDAITVILLPVSRFGLTRGHEDIGMIRRAFADRTAVVCAAPFDIRPTSTTRAAWHEIGQAVRSRL